MVREPARPGAAAGLLVGGAGEEHVAPQPGDRVAGGVEAGGAGPAGEEEEDDGLERHHLLHVDGRRVPTRSRPRCRRRTGRGSSRRCDWPAPRRGGPEQEERIAAGAVAAEAGDDAAATGDGLEDLGLEAVAAEGVGEIPRGVELGARRVRRVDRRDADQVAEERDELLVRGLPRRRVDGLRREGDVRRAGGHGRRPTSAAR